jgi:hypothetical protein
MFLRHTINSRKNLSNLDHTGGMAKKLLVTTRSVVALSTPGACK